MNVEFLLTAAETYKKKAADAELTGDVAAAKKNKTLAAKKYRQLAQLCPTRKDEFLACAVKCESSSAAPEVQEPEPLHRAEPQPDGMNKNSAKSGAENGADNQAKDYSGYNLNISKPNKSISFDAIIGLNDAKKAIWQDLILPLNHPEKYQKHNLKIGANTLLYGPPGTGKTTFAKAVASDVSVPFINVNSNALVDAYIGMTGKNVDKLFEEVRRFVREQKTAVILFIDEIDAIAQSRGSDNKTAQEAVPTLIKQLDGFDSDNSGIIIIAATNLSRIIDKAVLDRFKSQIYIPLPDEDDRRKIFELKLNEFNIEKDDLAKIDLDFIAKKSEGLSGRKITQIVDKFMRELVEHELNNNLITESYNDVMMRLIEKAR